MQSAVESDQSIPDVAYMDSYLLFLGWSAILLAQPFGCRVRFPGFALGFMEVAVRETEGIARTDNMELVDVKRLPALVRRLTTEGEARPNGALNDHVPCRWW